MSLIDFALQDEYLFGPFPQLDFSPQTLVINED